MPAWKLPQGTRCPAERISRSDVEPERDQVPSPIAIWRAPSLPYPPTVTFTLPDAPVDGLTSLVIRTDYTDADAWDRALRSASAPSARPGEEGFRASLLPIEDPALDGLDAPQVAALPTRSPLSHAFVADARTMADHTFIVLDMWPDHPTQGSSFRAAVDQIKAIQINLVLANVDWHEFASSADIDGVFRGFPSL